MTEHNPPAYPVFNDPGSRQWSCGALTSGGMSLLDHFAGLAMQAYISTGDRYSLENRAMFSYQMADAMLKERQSWIK